MSKATKTAPVEAEVTAEIDSLDAMIAQRDKLQNLIETEQAQRKAENVEKARAFISKNGLNVTDLFPDLFKSEPMGVLVKHSKSKKAPTLRPVAPKYRDSLGNTWTGRGFKPKWLSGAIADGAKLADFLIDKPADEL